MSTLFRLALITGATGGLGRALALALAKRKVALLLTATCEPALQELAQSLQPLTEVEFCKADLNSPASRETLFALIRKRTPDFILNNAGMGLYGEALSHSTDLQTQLVTVNAIATMEITLEAARALIAKKSRGTILNVSSAGAFFSIPFFSTYCASKAFVNQFSRAFAKEVQPFGIRVLVTCPGLIDTPFRIRASLGRNKTKTGHIMTAEKAAEAILHQAIHGPTLRVIDLFYRLAICFSRLLPSALVEKFLARDILSRIQCLKEVIEKSKQ